ncbi:MAG: LysM peptidoglycan-binding domain-containing protein [Candidatus Acidiferrales bacterium]
MKRRMTRWAIVASGTLLLAGCEGTTTKVQVRPPAAVPAPVPAYVREPLPLPNRELSAVSLRLDPRAAIDILVERVQASWIASQQDFKSGDPDQGRAELDKAVNLILSGGFQAESDPRLSKLFDQIGEAMHAYPSPPGQGVLDEAEDAEAAPPAQPAPIDEIADLTLPTGDPRLISKAQRELITVPHDLPLTVNDSVLQYLSFFTSPRGRAIVEHGLGRAGRYDDMIRRVLKEEGVPQDLIYLAQAESAFQPQAVSRAGARGIWQFMPYRGEQYDLERSYWIDERSDPEKATRAAARHLRDLYGMFGDWYLVMAAYNSGPLNVARAVERTGYADFWELQKRNALPKETQNYVPIIIAMALVAKAPALYGVQIEREKPADAEAVKLDHPVDLHLVADATGADLDGLRLLNPQLLRTVTPSEPGFELKLPVGLTARFEQNIQQVPEDKRTSWRLHTVSDGETLSDIARRYRLTVPAIQIANHLDARATVPSGFLLNVPTVPPVTRVVHYRVQRGDTLEGIADRFDVTVTDLKRWNHIAGDHAPRGIRLKVLTGSESAEISAAASSRASQGSRAAERTVSARNHEKFDAVQHKVKAGETLYSIAREYGITVSALKQSNPFLADRSIEAGDLLKIQR